ncbi:MAG: hypothetical protein QOI07_965 [Verrucomicrobiota bacterium]|jgi:hypothetical protein
MRRLLSSILLSFILALTPRTASSINPRATLDQLKHLEILCYVPGWLPKGFKLRNASITYDEPGPDEGSVGRFPLYGIEYGNGPTSPPNDSGRWSDRTGGATFTIESAREGIGDRNLMGTEDSEEITITSPFGPMYLIYTPKGKSRGSQKVEIKANWAHDPNMNSEKAKGLAHPILGRYHGFTGTAITVAEFEKIIQSLHPIR